MASVRTATTQPAQALAGPDGRFLDVDGVSIHHRVTGPADAPTILLFHHFYGNVSTWRHVHEACRTATASCRSTAWASG
jgi:pimeloyl-ACP methyl ester carboxylesterase